MQGHDTKEGGQNLLLQGLWCLQEASGRKTEELPWLPPWHHGEPEETHWFPSQRVWGDGTTVNESGRDFGQLSKQKPPKAGVLLQLLGRSDVQGGDQLHQNQSGRLAWHHALASPAIQGQCSYSDDDNSIRDNESNLFNQVEVVLDGINVAISPSEQMILKGVVTIIK